MKDCCIIIPIYKENIKGFELASFHRLFNIIKDKDIILLCPNDLDICFYKSLGYNFLVEHVDNIWLSSEEMYSKLLCEDSFYGIFDEYTYMMIYQLDAFIFYDNLDYFINLGYDYYGAPWSKGLLGNGVGNGGFSLRKISKFKDICLKHKNTGQNENGHYIWEDQWFCIIHRNRINIAPKELACKFALCSESPEEYFGNNSSLPMGAHKLFEHKNQIDFYNKFIK